MLINYNTQCPVCGNIYTLNLEQSKVNRWKDGELVQNVFPELNDDERELLTSGVCKDCWGKIFADQDVTEEYFDFIEKVMEDEELEDPYDLTETLMDTFSLNKERAENVILSWESYNKGDDE
ncbi:MAG: hypothetical protein EOM85_03420 [Candidatus Moranbacteria bacterium]|nr:hypothetical protein [Candidatus Moranbacteria bacterium]